MARTHGNFDMDAITVVGMVPTESIPKGTHPPPGGKRRWQELSDQIRTAPAGQSIVVSVRAGVNPETMRQGVQAELKRAGIRVSIRTVIESKDQTTSVYFTAIHPNS